MNLNLDSTTQRFISGLPIATTISTTIPATPRISSTATSAGATTNSKFVKNSDFHYVPLMMNNNAISVPSGAPLHPNLHQTQNQPYPAAGTTATPAAISITAAGNVNRSMPAAMAAATGGSVLHILPMQMNSAGAGINFVGGNAAFMTTGGHNNSGAVNSVNNSASLLPQVTFFATAVPGSAGGLTFQTATPAATFSTANISNNNNSLAINTSGNVNTVTSVAAPPMHVILTSDGSHSTAASGVSGMATGTPGAVATVMQQTTNNPGVATSILIRNQPQYTNATPTQRGAAVLPLLNKELVKQIVVGNIPKFTTTTPAATAAIVSSNQTLLKTQSTSNQRPTANVVQQPKKQPLQQTASKLPANTKMQQQPTAQKPKIPLAEAAKAVVTGSLSFSGCNNLLTPNRRDTISTCTPSSVIVSTNDELLKQRRQTIPPTSSQSLITCVKTTKADNKIDNSLQATQENTSFTTISNLPSPDSLLPKTQQSTNEPVVNSANVALNTVTLDVETPKTQQTVAEPQIKTAKITEKQESLLKARPLQRVTVEITSPRSKRSKSLNCDLKCEKLQQPANANAGERRHSTAAKSRPINTQGSPSADPALIKEPVQAKEPEIIDLIDYGEESTNKVVINNAETDLQTKQPTTNEIVLEDAANVEIKPIEKESGKEFKTQLPTSDSEVSSTTTGKGTDEQIKNEIELQPTRTETQDDATIIECKVESITVEDDDEHQDAAADVHIPPSDVHLKGVKPEVKPVSEDTQNLPENTEELLEKSLYCDEKISVSSTSSASTTSSRTSLQEDVVIVSPPKQTATADSALTSSLAAVTSTCALKMISTFNMLTWNHRIGAARDTQMRFRLNEFNLLEINEHCPPRTRIHTAFEKPIYERESVPNISEKQDGLLYFCRRCNCHGPAADFLAPEFCSLECLKRNTRKRRRDEVMTATRKQPRKDSAIPQMALSTSKETFRWSTYLPEKYNAIAAPVRLFLNPFPTGRNRFQIGMKLEAIDPENCALFCVCTIVDKQGYRLKLTFDGYEYMYDFWVNADSMDIFPPGWCAKTKRVLQPPKGKTPEEFSWPAYLAECKAVPAQRQLFTHLNALSSQNPFKVGMHLEAEDLNDTGKLCVASVADVIDNRIRVHFDGWDDCYDYWVDISSPYIHPCGWHVGRQQLIVPPDFENTTFNWRDYITNHGSGMAATEEMFAARDPIDFKPNMKLEVVDPRNASLIRPATVVGRKGHRIKLHLECWAMDYCFWLEDDSADLHPIGWCDVTGHELEPPPGYKMRSCKIMCPTFGCRGIGNAKRLYLNTHATRDCCPYAPENWRQKIEKPPRLEHDEIIRIANQKQTQQLQSVIAQQRQLNEKQILERIQLLDNIKTRHVLQQEKQQGAVSDYNGDYEQLIVIRDELKTEIEPQTELNAAESEVGDNSEVNEPLEHKLQIAKEFLCDYGPRLQQNYNIWQRNMAFDANTIIHNPLLWSTKETHRFIEGILNSKTAADTFEREDIDGNALLLLQQTDLTDALHLKLGPAVKLYASILQLRTLAVTKFDVKLSRDATVTRK